MKRWFDNVMTDETRALIIAFFPDLFNAAEEFGIYDFSDSELQVATSIATKVIVGIFYVYKKGQNQGVEGKTLAAQNRKKKTSR